ncbi:MAG TPA: branched-chain-amino-acid transaminase [Ruminiclostridium sp.]|nr:branched-chain-amino-acid transaminase [Ruminiclostridium sp.]
MENRVIYINGEFYQKDEAKISVFDHGFLYGDGIFEGIRAYNGKIFRCEEHINRLFDGARAIDLTIPISKEEITKATIETVKKNGIKEGYIRVVVSRGNGDLGLSPTKCDTPTIVIIADDITLYPKEMYENGMEVLTASVRRNSPDSLDAQIKSLNYLNNILAKIEANHAGVAEAIMLNHNGYVCECTGDNIFVVKENVIYTPPVTDGALNGITRKTVFELAAELGYTVIERNLTLANVYTADECFFSGTAAEIIGVTKVDKREIGNGKVGSVTRKLMDAFKNFVRQI